MTTPESSPSPVESLALVRVLLAGPGGAKAADVRRDLGPILGPPRPGAGPATAVDRALINLASAGLVVRTEGRTARAAATFAATDEGRRVALATLGVEQLPERPKPTWAGLKKSLLTAKALGLEASAAVARDDVLRAVLLDRLAGLELGGTPTLKRAKDAWTRKHLGMGPKEDVTLESVQAALFRRALADPPAAPLPSRASLDRLIAERLGAAGRPFEGLRDEVLRRWAAGEPGGPGAAAAEAPAAPPLDLAEFARRVREAARGCESGRHGGDKVLVVHAWRALQGDPAFRGGDFALFKKRLAEAEAARLLGLARADLVQGMNAEDVLLSEVPSMNTCFHFVRDDPGRGAAS